MKDAEKRRRALKRFLTARGQSLLSLTSAAGVSEAGVRGFLAGRSESLNETTYRKLAAAAGVTIAELMGEYTPPTELPLWGYAGAGEQVHPFDGDEPPPLDAIDAPPGLKDGAAVIVRGDSMLPRLQDGDVIFFEQKEMAPERLLNQECVVRVKDGPYLVKRLMKGSRRNRFHLISINPSVAPMFDQAILWAADIKWIKRNPPKR